MDALVSLVVSGLRDHMPVVDNSIDSAVVSDTHVLQDIASISVFSNQVIVALSKLAVKTSGFIQPREESYLSFVIDKPNFDAPDTYKCTAHGIRKNIQPIVLSDNVQVLITRSSLNEESRQKLENLESDVEVAEGEILAINKRQLEQYRNFSDVITALSSMQISRDIKIGAIESELEGYENISNHLISMVSDLDKVRVEDDSRVQSKLARLEGQNENVSAQIVGLEAKVQQYQNTSNDVMSQVSLLEKLQATVEEMSKNKHSAPNFGNESNNTNKTTSNVTFPQTLSFAQMKAELRRVKSAFLEEFYFVSLRYENSFYFLPKNIKERTIDESEIRCKKFGGYLVEINDQSEYDFIVSFIKDLPGFQTVYTGEEYKSTQAPGRIRKDLVYRRSKEPVLFTDWSRGEPNHLPSENCLTLEKTMGWKMNDNICTASSQGTFLCEVSYNDFEF
ncbi:unnamed protein product [Lymnaea stagnalis]|uniref:C-type lectin domain-containing protein n=1 Tax=Lymnaea stagnalis TaxID=6523 RepID=A0AAV2H892_LYMST